MADKQIHELTAITRSPESADVLALDTGSMTGKMTYSTFKTAVNADAMAAVNALSAAVVHVDAEQVLTDAQKATARENIGAVDDDDLAELENTINVELAGKVDVAQGASNSGKTLVVGANGNVTIGGSVRYDASQGLTSAQKEVARGNIDSVGESDFSEFENTVSIALAQKVDVSQGVVNAGGALVVGANGNVTVGGAVRYDSTQSLTGAQKSAARENIGAVDDDDLAELENTVNVALAGKVDVAQGASQAGKALVVGDDGNVTTGEAGIPEAVKTALLELLRHVAYDCGDGQEYLDALEEALDGDDFFNRWTWKLSEGQFLKAVNVAGYDTDSGQLYIGNSAVNDPRRRHLQVLRGIKPFKDGIGGEDTIYYPIPIPANASKVKLSITPSIQAACLICKLNGDAWTRILDTGWQSLPYEAYFDAAEDQVLVVGMRADSSNSDFTTATEPTEIVIEFGIDDFYDRWHWKYTDGQLSKQNSVATTTNDTATWPTGIWINGSNNRRTFTVSRGKVPYTDYSTKQPTAYYPVPVPATACKMTVSVTPNTQYVTMFLMSLSNGVYSYIYQNTWAQGAMSYTFTPAANQYMIISTAYSTSGSTYPTEPTELTVDFE